MPLGFKRGAFLWGLPIIVKGDLFLNAGLLVNKWNAIDAEVEIDSTLIRSFPIWIFLCNFKNGYPGTHNNR